MENEVPQLYRWEHVVTTEELIAIYQGWYIEYQKLNWWQWKEKLILKSAMGAVDGIIIWIDSGKRTEQ